MKNVVTVSGCDQAWFKWLNFLDKFVFETVAQEKR